MKMGIVQDIRKNGAVVIVKTEDSDLEQKYFIPGWAFNVNNSRQRQLTTTQGIGLSVGDLVNFYIDPNTQAKPYDGVACNVDILKHAEAPSGLKKVEKKAKPVKFGPQKKPPVSWYSFLMTEDLASESDADNDPTYEPPAEFEDAEDFDSDISIDEIQELAESLKVDVDALALQYAEVKVSNDVESEKAEPEAEPEAVKEDEPSKSEN